MEEYSEELISGFCKTQNETRRVFCEYELQDGKWVLTGSDCCFTGCEHFKTCVVMQEARKKEN